MRLALAAFVAAGLLAAPQARAATIGCRSADRAPTGPAGRMSSGPNLTLGTLTIEHFRNLADVVAFRRSRRGGAYRVRMKIFVDSDGPVTIAARGPSPVAFAFGRQTARVVTFAPCPPPNGMDATMMGPTFFTGEVIVRKAGCYTFAVNAAGGVFRAALPVGVARRC